MMQMIYYQFGVDKLVSKYIQDNNLDKLEQLDRILTKYIILRASDDIPHDKLLIFEITDFKNIEQLEKYFELYIPDFSEKLKIYGREFQGRFITD